MVVSSSGLINQLVRFISIWLRSVTLMCYLKALRNLCLVGLLCWGLWRALGQLEEPIPTSEVPILLKPVMALVQEFRIVKYTLFIPLPL